MAVSSLLTMKKEKWIVYGKKADFQGIAKKFGVDQVTARIMRNRGLTEEDEIEQYLNGTTESLADPSLLKDAEKAAALLMQAIAGQIKIAVASDYDDDGVFSGLLLKEALSDLGAEVTIYTPDRISEGYGLNRRIVEEALSDGAGMLVTCDNGIAAFEPVSLAKAKGMTVIVTDHHEVPFREGDAREDGSREKIWFFPEADAIVDPWQADCAYPFKGLCGTGVAFRLMELLYRRMGVRMTRRGVYLQYTAIATIADVMELKGENRVLVKEGLELLRKTEHTGLSAMMDASSISRENLRAYHVGFVLGPCFNAAGRLVTAEPAFLLLQEKDREKAAVLAAKIRQLNETRKDMTVTGVEQGIFQVDHAAWKDQPVYLVYLKDCHESVAGIVAGKLREHYYHPVLVFTDSAEEGVIKASGRSIEGYDMFTELNRFRDLFLRFGGHRMAAGLSMKKENLEPLRRMLNEKCSLTESDLTEKIMIDAPVPLSYLSEDLIEDLKKLEPFGRGNEKPVFARQHLKVLRYSRIGRNRNVVKMKVTEDGVRVMDALYFGDAEEFEEFLRTEFGEAALADAKRGFGGGIDIAAVYYPQINEYNGFRSLQIVLSSYCRI